MGSVRHRLDTKSAQTRAFLARSVGFVPRKPRIEVPGAVHRVRTRVLPERAFVVDAHDLVAFRGILDRVVRCSGWRCHAFAASAEGYVLDVETPAPTLSVGMRELNGTFARYLNDRDLACGHVFAARYESEVIAGPAN